MSAIMGKKYKFLFTFLHIFTVKSSQTWHADIGGPHEPKNLCHLLRLKKTKQSQQHIES